MELTFVYEIGDEVNDGYGTPGIVKAVMFDGEKKAYLIRYENSSEQWWDEGFPIPEHDKEILGL